MMEEINRLTDFLLDRKNELAYWTNENEYDFVARNRSLFVEFSGAGTSAWDLWVAAAKLVLPQLPVRFRERRLGESVQEMERPVIVVQGGEKNGFSLVLDETKVKFELHIRPVSDPDAAPVLIPISSADAHRLKSTFVPLYDPAARQTQLSTGN